MQPVLRALTIGDDPIAWLPLLAGSPSGARYADRSAPSSVIGGVALLLVGSTSERGVLALGFEGLPDACSTLHGVPVFASAPGDPAAHTDADVPSTDAATLPDRSSDPVLMALDHVVIRTPWLPSTIDACESAGLELRRLRDIGSGAEAGAQAFFLAGTAVLEVVGPREAAGHGEASNAPAQIWGLAFVVADPAGASDALGSSLGEWRPAVQSGRQIATVRTETMGISTHVALMTPRP